jgi:hypothetical protein
VIINVQNESAVASPDSGIECEEGESVSIQTILSEQRSHIIGESAQDLSGQPGYDISDSMSF